MAGIIKLLMTLSKTKIKLFYLYKSAGGSVYEMSILDFKQRLIKQIDDLNENNILCYYGDMNDKDKRKLVDVNDINMEKN